MRKRILDLCSGAGGAAVGYERAGFDVVGVDNTPQPHYPFRFFKMDALVGLTRFWQDFDAIHMSPPCQRWSRMANCRPDLAAQYPDLVEPLRKAVLLTGLPYVLENVEGAPLRDPITLCGTMFGRELYRHRLFETNFHLPEPTHGQHLLPTSRAGHWVPGTIMSVAGHCAPIAKAREIMGIDWTTREELAEAIPPDFTTYVGYWLMRFLEGK